MLEFGISESSTTKICGHYRRLTTVSLCNHLYDLGIINISVFFVSYSMLYVTQKFNDLYFKAIQYK